MQESPFYLVWNPRRGTPHFKHEDRVSAEAEARRLATLSPDDEFFVLAPVQRVAVRHLYVENFDPNSNIPF